jgi:hypothetical protein
MLALHPRATPFKAKVVLSLTRAWPDCNGNGRQGRVGGASSDLAGEFKKVPVRSCNTCLHKYLLLLTANGHARANRSPPAIQIPPTPLCKRGVGGF